MKLSEILPDYPIKPGKRIELNMLDLSELLTSCDYEIYRDELAKEIHKKEYRSIKWHESPLGVQNAYLARADHIISTMPTWLKRIEK